MHTKNIWNAKKISENVCLGTKFDLRLKKKTKKIGAKLGQKIGAKKLGQNWGKKIGAKNWGKKKQKKLEQKLSIQSDAISSTVYQRPEIFVKPKRKPFGFISDSKSQNTPRLPISLRVNLSGTFQGYRERSEKKHLK